MKEGLPNREEKMKPKGESSSFFDQCIKKIAKERVVLDLGTFYSFRKQLKKYEDLFKQSKYFSMDYKISKNYGPYTPNVDGNIMELPFKSGKIDAIICKDVLEHIPEPQKAVREMHRILKKGGKIFATVPFIHPYHGSQSEKNRDYWRFTQDGINFLFKDFEKVEIRAAGGAFIALRSLMPSRIEKALQRQPFLAIINFLDKAFRTRSTTSTYMIWAIK